MKLLTEDEIVELIEADASDRTQLADRMAPVCDPETADWFTTHMPDPANSVTTILHGGRKVGAVWWWYSPGNKTLVLAAGASFVQDDTSACFEAAYRVLAKRLGAQSLEIQTRRPGVIRLYRRNGWAIQGVSMIKRL